MESAVSAHGTKYASKVAVLNFLVSSIFGFFLLPTSQCVSVLKVASLFKPIFDLVEKIGLLVPL